MTAIEVARPLRAKVSNPAGAKEKHARRDNVVEEPHAEQGRSHATDGGGYHMRDRGGDLDGQQARNAHGEAQDTLQDVSKVYRTDTYAGLP